MNLLQTNKRSAIVVYLVTFLCLSSALQIKAQGDSRYESKFKSTLNSVMNYRYGDISVFEVEGTLFTQIQNLLNEPPSDSLAKIAENSLREDSKGAIIDAIDAAMENELTSIDEINTDLLKNFSPSEINSKNVQAYVQYKVAYFRLLTVTLR